MATIPEALDVAVQYHQAGQWQQAEAICQQILQVDSGNADALHLLGVIAYQAGKNDLAVEYVSHAICIRPSDPFLHYNLGKILHAQGKLAEGAAHYQQGLYLNPDFADAHFQWATYIGSKANWNQHWCSIKKPSVSHPITLRRTTTWASSWNQEVNWPKRSRTIRKAVRLQPGYAEAYYNVGNVLKGQDKLAEAIAQYQEAVRLKPDFAEAYNNLGKTLQEQDELGTALACYQQALSLKADYAEAHSNLGSLLIKQGQLAEAVAQSTSSLPQSPPCPSTQYPRQCS